MADEIIIQVVAVIGAGEQGRAFALRCAQAGFCTVLEDVMPAKLRQAEQALTSLSGFQAAGRLSFALTVEEAVREADVAIDFVPDELESKLEIFSMVDRMAPPKTILCTPTDALSISDLASCTYRADRCVGLREFNPAWGTACSLTRGERTTDLVIGCVKRWLGTLGVASTVAEDHRWEARDQLVR